MQQAILKAYQEAALFYTPRAMAWNIKTLGFGCWLRCLALNARELLAEQYRGLAR